MARRPLSSEPEGTESAGPDPAPASQPDRRPIRILDVAVRAGVSKSTVSKALNGRSDVGADTRERIKAIVAELGFRPNQLARSLPTGRSFSVGMMTTDSFGRFSIPIMLGVEDLLHAGEMAVIFCDSRDDPAREAQQLRSLLDRNVDGIVVTGRRTEPRAPFPSDLPIPVVYAFAPSSRPSDCSVTVDEVGGTRLAVEHLLAVGRRRIAHITGPQRHRSAAVRARAAGEVTKRHGLELAHDPLFGTWSESWGREAVQVLLDEGTAFDAVFCGSDQIGRGVADGLRESGLSVPADVALVGFDNWDVMAEASRPALTTIDMNIAEVGRQAGRMLLDAIGGAVPHSGTVQVSPRLVVRDSTRI